jgi:hypothetical protein
MPLLAIALGLLLTLACTDAAHSTAAVRVAATPSAVLTPKAVGMTPAAASTTAPILVKTLASVGNTGFYRTTVEQPFFALPRGDEPLSKALEALPIGTLHADVAVDVDSERSTQQAAVVRVPFPSVASNGAFRRYPLADIYGWTEVVVAKRVQETSEARAPAPAHSRRFTELYLTRGSVPFALIDCYPVRQLEQVGPWQKVIAYFPDGELVGWVNEAPSESTACFERALPERYSARSVPDAHLPVAEAAEVDARLIALSSARATVFELSQEHPDCREFRFVPKSSDGRTGQLVSGTHQRDYSIGGALLLHYVCLNGVKPRTVMGCERVRQVVGLSDSSLTWLWLFTSDLGTGCSNPIVGYHPARTQTWFLNRQQCEQAARARAPAMQTP